ncbi:MAG: porphobilinogen synthase [Flavobacteriaceae bacterium]
MYPHQRNRRLRSSESLRQLIREFHLTPHDFIVPLFVIEGTNKKEEIPSMPGYYRLTLDLLEIEIRELWDLGLRAVLLFVKVPDAKKDNQGNEALNSEGLMQQAIRRVKKTTPEMVVMTDVALDPYSNYGHDGIVENGLIVNDPTTEVLAAMALSHAVAGADIVAPSDMMDGRIGRIRQTLEKENHTHVGILSYSAKYASSFYGPFRDALNSAPGFGDKKTYQMDFANRFDALTESKRDVAEGADLIMIKPGMPYLDIVFELKQHLQVPIAVYQVSGEYAMLKAAAEKGWLDYEKIMLEQLIAFKRAGASLIASYHAKEVAQWYLKTK